MEQYTTMRTTCLGKSPYLAPLGILSSGIILLCNQEWSLDIINSLTLAENFDIKQIRRPSSRQIHQQFDAMSGFGAPFTSEGFDVILNDLASLKRYKDLSAPVDAYLNGDYRTV